MAKIIGGTATSSMLVPDWNQTNPNRADYIKNKPDVANALKGSAKGNPVIIDDVSPVKHEISATVYKNTVGKPITHDLVDSDVPNNSFYTVKTYTYDIEDSDSEHIYYVLTFTFEEGGFYGGEYNGSTPPIVEIGSTVYFAENNLCYVTQEPYDGATLQTFGKNLWDMNLFSELFVPDPDEDGGYISTKNVSTTHKLEVNLPAGVYTISGYVKSLLNPTDNRNENVSIAFYYADGTRDTYTKPGNGEYKFQSVTSNGKPIEKIGFWYRKDGGIVGLKDIQLEIGSTYTEYEPFKGETYTADGEGNVKATSIYPTTFLRANSDASVVAEYNRDINKAIESDINTAIEDAEKNIKPAVEEIVNKSIQPRKFTAVGINLSKTPCLYLGEIILVHNSAALCWDAYICTEKKALGGEYVWHKLN